MYIYKSLPTGYTVSRFVFLYDSAELKHTCVELVVFASLFDKVVMVATVDRRCAITNTVLPAMS